MSTDFTDAYAKAQKAFASVRGQQYNLFIRAETLMTWNIRISGVESFLYHSEYCDDHCFQFGAAHMATLVFKTIQEGLGVLEEQGSLSTMHDKTVLVLSFPVHEILIVLTALQKAHVSLVSVGMLEERHPGLDRINGALSRGVLGIHAAIWKLCESASSKQGYDFLNIFLEQVQDQCKVAVEHRRKGVRVSPAPGNDDWLKDIPNELRHRIN